MIHCVQAGFVGPWGEWHSSLLFEDLSEDAQVEIRNDIVTLLLDNIDSSLPIAVRRPSFIVDYADAGLNTSRLCVYNDGLFGSDSDLGTYNTERSEAISEWNSVIGASTNGGEMPYVTEWTEPNSVNSEMSQMKISYLNAYYNTEVLDSWNEDTLEGENALTYIGNHLGYRFYISEITSIDYISSCFLFNRIPIELTLSNSGYSEIEDSYVAEIIIRSGGTILETISIDSLSTISADSPLTVNTTLSVNREIAENGIDIGLKIYDTENENNLLYHVALANDKATYEDGINWFPLLLSSL